MFLEVEKLALRRDTIVTLLAILVRRHVAALDGQESAFRDSREQYQLFRFPIASVQRNEMKLAKY